MIKKILFAIFIICFMPFCAYAAGADYLGSDEQAVLDEINLVRTNPAKYAQDYLVPLKSEYKGNEGQKALDECINALKTSQALGKLKPSKGLSQAAKDHVNEQGPTGSVGHSGNNGSSPWDRMNKYGTYSSSAGENISYGYDNARDIVIQLLIDDGVPSRGHRKNIMGKDFHYVGIAIGTHAKYDYMCVLDFAGGYTESSSDLISTDPVPETAVPEPAQSKSQACSATLSADEKRLYDLIMEYRKSKGLAPIPLSPSLSFVAQTHARDLAEHPPASGCNGHSWSSYGDWSSCCYTPDHAQARCMWDKPKELTDYTGSGFEISAWSSDELTPDKALSMWKDSSPHNAVVINTGIWKDSNWQAIGIGLYGSRGVVWFGKVKDVCLGK